MLRSSRLIQFVAALVLAPACASDTVQVDDGPEDTTGDGDGDGDSTDSTSGDTDEPPVELGGPARGITIDAVEFNQGTAVELVRDGETIQVEQRNAPLVHHRDTLIRLHHTIDDPDAWIDRELTGILHVEPPDGGEELVRTRTMMVVADSDPRQLQTNFYFSLLADEAVPGSEFWIELRETDGGLDVSSLGEGRAVSPIAPEPIEFDDAPLELRIVLVPVLYEHLDPPRTPDISAEDLALFHDFLLQQNPVQIVDIAIRDTPIVRTEQLTNLGSLLAPTREAKLQDGAGANVYYHALVDVGGPSVNQVGGIASLTDASEADSLNRVAATVYYKQISVPDEDEEDQTPTIYPPINSARTFVHEIGHNQGFRHIACPNADAAGPDPSYPYADGKIGVHGFGIRDFHVYTPTASHDYMSYCGNAWTSDWTWNKAYARIQALTSWDYQSSGSSRKPTVGLATAPSLVGLISADGGEEWRVFEGIAGSPAPSAEHLEYWVDGELVASEAAEVELLSDDATVMITAPLPVAPAQLDAVIRVQGDHRFAVELGPLQARDPQG